MLAIPRSHHEGLRDVGAAVEDGTGVTQESRQRAVALRDAAAEYHQVGQTSRPDKGQQREILSPQIGAVALRQLRPLDIKLILERHRNAV